MPFKINLVLGLLVVYIETTTSQRAVVPFCFEGDCYIRPEYSGKSWTDAQQMCRHYNSTLPIVDNPDRQRSFVAALYNFSLNSVDVWLGARAFEYGPGIWRWLDGSQYSGTAIQDVGSYDKSYAFLSKRSTSVVLAYASVPYEEYSYVCQYNTIAADACTNGTGRLTFNMENRCYVKYIDVKLSWFKARNECLNNDGDLTSVSDISLLEWMVDSTETWVGLQHSQWNWQNAATGTSSEVTFTSWIINQPDDLTPSCISVDYDNFPYWKDGNCSQLSIYICQVVNIPLPTLTPSMSTSTNPGSRGTQSRSNSENSTTNYQLSSATDCRVIAVGVGIGIPCLIIIVVLSVIIIVQQRKLRGKDGVKSRQGQPKVADSNGGSTPSPVSTMPVVENDANLHYEQLKNRNEQQDQRQYEQLPQSQI